MAYESVFMDHLFVYSRGIRIRIRNLLFFSFLYFWFGISKNSNANRFFKLKVERNDRQSSGKQEKQITNGKIYCADGQDSANGARRM